MFYLGSALGFYYRLFSQVSNHCFLINENAFLNKNFKFCEKKFSSGVKFLGSSYEIWNPCIQHDRLTQSVPIFTTLHQMVWGVKQMKFLTQSPRLEVEWISFPFQILQLGDPPFHMKFCQSWTRHPTTPPLYFPLANFVKWYFIFYMPSTAMLLLLLNLI